MDLGVLQAVSWWAILPLVVLGSLLHFLYDWSGHSRVAAVFGAVNESYWEHIKIAVWPVLVIAVAQAIFVLMLGQLQPNAAMVLLAAVYLVGLLGAFLKFTLQPPHEPDVFIDPLTNRYGVHGHAKDLDAHLSGTDRGAGN